jgi:hypothetical protein
LDQKVGVCSHLLFEHLPYKLSESGFYVFEGEMVGDPQHECRVLKRCGNCALEPHQEAGGVDLLGDLFEQGIPDCLGTGIGDGGRQKLCLNGSRKMFWVCTWCSLVVVIRGEKGGRRPLG